MAHIVDSTTITDTITMSEVRRPEYKVYDNDADIVGYWPMSQVTCANATDLSDNEYHLSAAATAAGWPLQVGGNIIEFNADHDTRYVLSGANCPNLNMSGTGSFTIVSRVRLHYFPISTYHSIARRSGQYELSIKNLVSTKKISMLIRNASGYNAASGATSLSYETWYSLAGRYSAPSVSTAGEVVVYLNGTSDGTTVITAGYTVIDSSGTSTIGTRYSAGKTSGSSEFHGQMNYVAIFSRALSLPELSGIAAYGIYPHPISIHRGVGFKEVLTATLGGDIFTGLTEEMALSSIIGWSISRQIAENMSIGETVFGIPYEYLDPQDIGITELLQAFAYVDTIVESMTPSEVLSWAFGLLKSENLNLTEALSWHKDVEIQSETFSLDETLAKLVKNIYSAAEVLNLSESLSFFMRGLLVEHLTMSENLLHSTELPEILWRPSG